MRNDLNSEVMKRLFVCFCLLIGLSANAVADDWMSRLPDHIFVSQVSIPGTHDTATGNGVTLAVFSQCQDVPMDVQWASGIRAFDLRPIVKDDHLHINHGVAETKLRFDDALYLLRDSLIAHPTEFAVVHLLYANKFSEDKTEYAEMLGELLSREDLKDHLVVFKRSLTVGEMRGKILLLSRDQYAAQPFTGGFFTKWCGYLDWAAQSSCSIKGIGSKAYSIGKLYVQDYSQTENETTGVQVKIDAVEQLLDFSTKYDTSDSTKTVWVFNFASSYPGSLSTADGYRHNASLTNAAIIEYLKENEAGPTGVVLMDYACVDSGKNFSGKVVDTRGQELVDTLIANNFKWLDRINKVYYDKQMGRINRLCELLEEVVQKVNTECPDVASDFVDDIAAAKDSIGAMQQELDSLFAEWKLSAKYMGDYLAVLRQITAISTAAAAAQAEYNESVGIGSIDAVEDVRAVRMWSLTGQRIDTPVRGSVYLVRYSDGRTRKVRY